VKNGHKKVGLFIKEGAYSSRGSTASGVLLQTKPLIIRYSDIFTALYLDRKRSAAALICNQGRMQKKIRRRCTEMRRRKRRYRDAEGVEGAGIGEGCPPSSADKRVWGSVVSSPSRVRRRAPAANAFSSLWLLYVKRKCNILLNMVTILTTATAEIRWDSVGNF